MINLIQKDDFRNFVSKRIADSTQKTYSFPSVFPPLYRYRSLSTYAIDDILNSKITLTSIGEFNDIFDGAIHQYGSTEEIEKAAEAKWTEMETLLNEAHLSEDILRRNDVVKPHIEHLKIESRLRFRELDDLGTYVCCFSKDFRSTLMWAHYADSNKGLCIEYDFNNLPISKGDLIRKSIFPVAYTSEPIDVSDLMDEKGSQIYQYPIDAAVLCTALNKASVWQYEQEWRIVWILASFLEKDQRMTINSLILPSKLYFGYHFLRPFFCYNLNSDSERDKCNSIIKKFIELVSFIHENEIEAAVMAPSIGSYQLKPYDISAKNLYKFMLRHFHNKELNSIHCYYTIHDNLMDLLEKSEVETNV